MSTALNKKGFASFLEVMTTGVIFTLAAAGIMASVSALRPQSAESERKIKAAYAAKAWLEELRASVDADPASWDEASQQYINDLRTGTRSTVIDGQTVTYTVSPAAGLNNLWEVEATVSY